MCKAMLKSMTGYGRGQAVTEKWDITVEIKSVNHRYFEWSAKLPKAFLFLEDKLKQKVQEMVSRGKVEVLLSVYSVGSQSVEVEVNEAVASNYVNALRKVAPLLSLEDNIKVTDLMRFSDIFTIKRVEVNEDELWNEVSEVADVALASFIEMKEKEGEKLKDDVLGRRTSIENMLSEIEKRSPMLKGEYYERLYQKIKELLEDKNVEESRLVTEAGIFADKVAVDEETVRLRSHLHQLSELLSTDEPVGRKLDFLVQEMNREVNTIGSKSQDIAIARMVVDMKAEIEKIREQIQNIE